MRKILSIALLIVLCVSLASCGATTKKDELWSTALYTKDTTIGEGEKTVTVLFGAKDKEITFTIKTDKEILGDALMEHKLISGEKGPYGMYVKTVNGITADYDKDKSYWAFYKNGEYMNTGVDSEKIKGGEEYEISYTK